MDKNHIIMVLDLQKRGEQYDIEVPLHLTVNELFSALNEGFHLNIDSRDITQYYLSTENPIALLKGNKKISDYGLRNGTIIHFSR
jgi:uncharacterized ubiquitin-like protein YukD